ncbi:MAG TPA: hypothetical protein VG733_04755, partial [Chthoniobacteraceae bacterium]|nr:hypothetical protein [Chthoniobacteraceae bacterium]
MRLLRSPALLLAGFLLASCYHAETLKVAAWKAPAMPDAPAASVFPELSIPAIGAKENIGISFSGGGNRAAVCAMGELRALRQIGLLSRVRYISSVSGATWCCGPYCFLQKKEGDGADWVEKADNQFFGPYIPPEKLNLDALASNVPGSFSSCAQNSILSLTRYFKLRGDKSWAYVLAGVYLVPLEITKENHFIAYDEKSAQSIIARNPDAGLKKDDFLWCPPGRPYLLAGASFVQPLNFNPATEYYPLELTPNYIGARAFFPLGNRRHTLGGGYVESAGYDMAFDRVDSAGAPGRPWIVTSTSRPRGAPSNFRASPRFSLADLLATSGAAPTVPYPTLAYIVGFPKFTHWDPGALGVDTPVTHVKIHTDGGGSDNSGVAALVARGVPRIIAFINSQMDLTTDRNHFPLMPTEVTALFGGANPTKSEVPWIFPKEEYPALEAAFNDAWKNRGSPVITTTLTTRENDYYLIPA